MVDVFFVVIGEGSATVRGAGVVADDGVCLARTCLTVGKDSDV